MSNIMDTQPSHLHSQVLHFPSLPKLSSPPHTSLTPNHNLKSEKTRPARLFAVMDEVERSAKRQKLASDNKSKSDDDEAFFQAAEGKVELEV